MASYNEDWVTQLKNASNIVSVISKYITVERKGKRWWACCPFHFEKTPSFAIDETRQSFHCFGCGASGDVISFVRKYENLEFMDACRVVAKQCNFEIPEIQYDETIAERKKKTDRMYALLRDATSYYHNNLKDSQIARDYIAKRQLDDETVKAFGIGYSKDWTGVIDALKAKGYTVKEMQESGLIEYKNGKYFDCYAGRLMFPIINSFGSVVGFSGRVLEDKGWAKYKNTAQTNLGFRFTAKESSDFFDKSKCLYGIYQLKKLRQAQPLTEIILVEGQMDVISLYRNGVKNAVASLGTAFTEQHIRELKRFCNKIVLCFDGDDAGVKATLRTIEVLLKDPEIEIYAVHLPDKTDPDEYVLKYGKDAFYKIINSAKYWVEYLIDKYSHDFDISKRDEKTKFVEKSLEVLRKISSVSEREIYLKMISDISGINASSLNADLGKVEATTNAVADDDIVKENAYVKAVKFVLSALLNKKEYAYFDERVHENLLNYDIKQVYEMLEREQNLNVSSLKSAFDVENNVEIRDIMEYIPRPENDNKSYYDDCVDTINKNGLKARQNMLLKEIENETDTDKKKQLYINLNEIAKKLKR